MKTALAALVLLPLLSAVLFPAPRALAGDDRDPLEKHRRLLAQKGVTCESLAREHQDILAARKALDEKYDHIKTSEEARAYVKEQKALRDLIHDYEAKRCAFVAAFPVIPDPPRPLSP